MKEKILSALKTKHAGVQDSVLGRIADKLAKTVKTEEEITVAVEAVTIQQIIESYGDSRATEATQTALQNHRKKLGLDENDNPVNPKPGDPKPGDPTPPDPNEPAWFKAYREAQDKQTADLKAKLEGYEKSKTQEAIRGKLVETLKTKGVDEVFIPLLTRNLTIESEDAIEATAETLLTDYKDIVQKKADQGVVISIPPDGKGKPQEGEDVGKSIAEKKNANSSEGVQGKKV